MNEPRRIMDSETDSLGGRLLRAAELERAPSGALSRALRTAGLAAGAMVATSASASAATSAAGVTPGAAVAGAGATVSATSGVMKVALTWLAVGGVGGAVLIGTASRLSAPSSVRTESPAAQQSPGQSSPATKAGSGHPGIDSRAEEGAMNPPAAEGAVNPPALDLAEEPALRRSTSGSPARTRGAPNTGTSTEPLRTEPLAATDRTEARAGSAFPLVETPVASPMPTEASTPKAEDHPAFSEELKFVDQARTELARGNAHAALARAQQYRSRFPRGQFQPEMMALAVEALSATGDGERARALAGRFINAYPKHPLRARVSKAAGLP
ncbi:MAG TPA: outer membrane protein assembly factor BamD [Polyangiaceae bacterium]